MTDEIACGMIEEIRKEKTEASQMGVISNWEKKFADPEPVVKHKRSKRTKFLIWLKTGESILDSVTCLEQLQISQEDEKKEIIDRLQKHVGSVQTIVSGRRCKKGKRRAG